MASLAWTHETWSKVPGWMESWKIQLAQIKRVMRNSSAKPRISATGMLHSPFSSSIHFSPSCTIQATVSSRAAGDQCTRRDTRKDDSRLDHSQVALWRRDLDRPRLHDGAAFGIVTNYSVHLRVLPCETKGLMKRCRTSSNNPRARQKSRRVLEMAMIDGYVSPLGRRTVSCALQWSGSCRGGNKKCSSGSSCRKQNRLIGRIKLWRVCRGSFAIRK
jgi:hypothetical protein